MRLMRALAGLAPALLLAACQQPAPATNQSTTPAQTAPTQSPVERGKYLTLVGGCNDCHTPKKLGPDGPEADMSRELSGNPATGETVLPGHSMQNGSKVGNDCGPEVPETIASA